MKRYYSLVISVLDKDGNRVDAHEIDGGNNKKDITKERVQLKKEVKDGKYNKLIREGCTLEADIEVHDDDTWELI